MDVLRRFTPDLEIYSIDEAFLGLQGFGARLESHARALRAAVLQWTGIPVSIGIAPTKTLAKVANHVAKKEEKHGGAVLLLDEVAQDAALARIELTDLWGVAGRLAERLKAIGVNTPLDLKRGDPWLIRERLGVVTLRLALELRGLPCINLERGSGSEKHHGLAFLRAGGNDAAGIARGCGFLHRAGGREIAPAASGDLPPDRVYRNQSLQTG
jgi:DNA polymerase V